jgi:hypothetical protein
MRRKTEKTEKTKQKRFKRPGGPGLYCIPNTAFEYAPPSFFEAVPAASGIIWCGRFLLPPNSLTYFPTLDITLYYKLF